MAESLLDRCARAAELARKLGADDAKVSLGRARGVEIDWRDGKLERIQDHGTQSLRAELYIEGRYGTSSTSDLRPEAVEAFLAEAVALTRLLEPDPDRQLPDPARYAQDVERDLDLFDAGQAEIDAASRLSLAREIEACTREAAREVPVASVSASVADAATESARVHTNGFAVSQRGTRFSRGATVVLAAPDGRKPAGYGATVRRHARDLDPIETFCRRAVSTAAPQLDVAKLPTGRYPVVVDRRALPRLVGALLAPLSGAALHQRRSVWAGRCGEAIASPLLTLRNAPHLPRGLGSALWDGDGFATAERAIIDAGVLRTYLIGDYHARKLGVEPTGAGTQNLDWALGNRDFAALVRDVHEGVLIDRFLGGNSNGATGAISLGCGGRRIRGGALAEGVAEINLAGDLQELFESLVALGNDPSPNSAVRAPTAVFDHVQLSGV